MKIFVLGTRGIPNILGGVETHCEELYPHLAKDNANDITVICRSSYVQNSELKLFKGVYLKTIYAPKNRTFEAIVHSLLGVLYQAIKRPDILHIHAVGPNLVTPLARLLGLKVVMTHHGPDYERKKWGKMAKFFLKIGEWAGVTFANRVIVISEEIKEIIAQKYNRNDAILIPNGVNINGNIKFDELVLNKFDLKRHCYVFALGRFVPEKGFDYLIRAFRKANINSNIKLVLAGDSDHETPYSLELKKQAIESGIILTGFIKGNVLEQLFSNCALFVIPSFYEGLPIVLLEAMAYKLPIIASDIRANIQVGVKESSYFKVGNESELTHKLTTFFMDNAQGLRIDYDMDKYDWANIAISTNNVYRSIQT